MNYIWSQKIYKSQTFDAKMSNTLFDSTFIIFVFALLLLTNVCHGSHSSLQIVNGYKGVVIALSPEIDVSNKDDFIIKIKVRIVDKIVSKKAAKYSQLLKSEIEST